MLLIFANSKKYYLGGVEIFNENLERLLEKHNIDFKRIETPKMIAQNRFLSYLYRSIVTVLYSWFNYNKKINILVQHGSFWDIMVIPMLSLSFRNLYVISHVNAKWRHIKRPLLKFITNVVLNRFVKELLLITDEQFEVYSHPNKHKISTIIDEQFYKIPTKPVPQNGYILFLGRICKEKGVEDLIEVYYILNKKQRLPCLKLVGHIEQTYFFRLKKKIENYNLSEKVKIEAPVYDTIEKINLIDNSLMLVYPSYQDTFPLIMVESFARKRICLISSIGETRNFIGLDDYLFEVGNKEELLMKLSKLINGGCTFNHSKGSRIYRKAVCLARGKIVRDLKRLQVI